MIREQLCCSSILRDREVWTSIVVEVSHGCTSLLSVDRNPRFYGFKSSMPIALEHNTTSTVVARGFQSNTEEVLTQEHILVSVRVEVSHRDAEGRRALRLERESHHIEMVSAIEQAHGVECCCIPLVSCGGAFAEDVTKLGLAKGPI